MVSSFPLLIIGISVTHDHAYQIPIPTRNIIVQNGFSAATVGRRRSRLCESAESSLDESPPASDRKRIDEVPSMDWLTDALSDERATDADTAYDPIASATKRPGDHMADLTSSPFIEEHTAEGDLGDVPIPTTGISVADEIDKAQRDRFYTEVVRITGLGKGVLAAQIITSTRSDSFEPVRYLVSLTRRDDRAAEGVGEDVNATNDPTNTDERFVMIDVPPYSEKLVQQMQALMGPSGHLSSILVTSRDCIHYDDSPSVFTIRRADLLKWEKAFPKTAIVAYRMDIPRDCRDAVTQRLDGYGPWAMEDPMASGVAFNAAFVETGPPLKRNEWDSETAKDILAGKRKPPGESDDSDGQGIDGSENGRVTDLDATGKFTAQSIRANEEGKKVLAVYTPGRTYGSMSYVFPELGLCASGFTMPLEDTRGEENPGVDSAGPVLDCRGYITTNKAGITRQVDSARKLVNDYVDRFQIFLPSRGDPFYLKGGTEKRRKTLLEIVDQFEKLGKIYEQLGITPGNGDF